MTTLREAPLECGHDLCNCWVRGPVAGDAYCSSFCRNADSGGIEDETCSCGHPECDTP